MNKVNSIRRRLSSTDQFRCSTPNAPDLLVFPSFSEFNHVTEDYVKKIISGLAKKIMFARPNSNSFVDG